MKVWELDSLCRDRRHRRLPRSVASTNLDWAQFADWFWRIDRLVDAQDRAALDHPVPHELARAVLAQIDLRYVDRVAQDGYLYSARNGGGDLTALEAFDRYGDRPHPDGNMLEVAEEKGRAWAGPWPQPVPVMYPVGHPDPLDAHVVPYRLRRWWYDSAGLVWPLLLILGAALFARLYYGHWPAVHLIGGPLTGWP